MNDKMSRRTPWRHTSAEEGLDKNTKWWFGW